MNASWLSLSFFVRASLVVGGVVVFLLAWPVARSAVIFQKTDALYGKVGEGAPYTLEELQVAIANVDAAIAADPVAFRYAQRSELLGSAAATPALKVSNEQRRAWQSQAKSDIERSLANDPARTVDWQRLVFLHESLDGPSRDILPILFMSIDTGPMSAWLWPPRVRVILDHWGYFTDEERERLGTYIALTWRKSPDRRWFGRVVYGPIDEIILRYVLQHEPNAEEELTKWIKQARS